jgi:2-polyprenyl-6-methoxyphenol hydroxylase-like FAD-dependent oxidoreductase
MATSNVAIVGAGPYGLSTAAHLRAADGLDIDVLGEPMSFLGTAHGEGHASAFSAGWITPLESTAFVDSEGLPGGNWEWDHRTATA